MKNSAVLPLFLTASFGFWVLTSMYVFSPLWQVGVARHSLLGVFTWTDLLEIAVYGAWAVYTAWLGRAFFFGSSALAFRWTNAAFIVLLVLYRRGLFIPSNYQWEFFLHAFLYVVLVAVAAWYGIRKYPTPSMQLPR